MAGQVLVDNQPVTKAGTPISSEVQIRIRGNHKYVGKGGLKLEGALADFKVDVSGKVVLDAGASSGGFTDCLLRHGAARVYAVDAGYGALAGKLRADPRVVNLERTNIGALSREQLDPLPSLATLDLSYLSLRKAIPLVADLMTSDGQIIGLVKPLFEVPDAQVRRTGRIDDSSVYVAVLQGLVEFAETSGLRVLDVTHSHLRGNKGTVEFFMLISKDRAAQPQAFDAATSVRAAMLLPLWDKEQEELEGGAPATSSC
jgi:23S rRNA (cytidine1920-2'-O)/16S rRNA (cytidine1409-2'-O)-methyltransferase